MAVARRHHGDRTGRQWPTPARRGALAVAVTVALGASLAPLTPSAADLPPGVTVEGAMDRPVPLERAGSFLGWGLDRQETGLLTPPASLSGVALREVAMSANMTLALTADGRVVPWGYNPDRVQNVPADIASLDAVDLAASYANAGIVTAEGTVRVWGNSSSIAGDPTDVPAGLTGVTQLALAGDNAVALKEDGSVVAWGLEGRFDIWPELNTPPLGLRATAIAAAGRMAVALRTNGTVASWGSWKVTDDGPSDPATLPPETQIPGNVTAIAAVDFGGVALLADGSLATWGSNAAVGPVGVSMPDLDGKRAVALAGSSSGPVYAVMDEDGALHFGGYGVDEHFAPPAEAHSAAISQFAMGGTHVGVIVTELLAASAPRVSGVARVGSVLTATQGEFSGGPDDVSGTWLAGGAPIPGATGSILTLTPSLVGKAIAYRSTATKAGSDPVVSTSTPTAPVTAAADPVPLKSASSVSVGGVKVAKKAKKVTVDATVSATTSRSGQAKITIAKGKKTIVSRTASVAADGTISLVIKKFSKLVKKATKKSKYTGKYTVTVEYAGNSTTLPSSTTTAFKVKAK